MRRLPMSTPAINPADALPKSSAEFLEYVSDWFASVPHLNLAEDWSATGIAADNVAVLVVDMVNGFCHEGPLAGARVSALIPPVQAAIERSHALGVRHFLLPQDTHEADAAEFAQFGPHCVAGTAESATVPELSSLPAAADFTVVPKNSLHPAYGTALEGWLAEHPEVRYFLIVGDCTDLCIYQTAMYLRLSANAAQRDCQVIVPENCVQTYDLPVTSAQSIGAMPHDGDLLHLIFLYSMALNGVRIVKAVE
jgi:nicotinamidase-related amidase